MTHKDAGSKYSKTQLRTSGHWKVEVKSFPMVYDMPILSNIGVSYTAGKLLTSTFQQKYGNLRTSSVLAPGVLDAGNICYYTQWGKLLMPPKTYEGGHRIFS